MKRILKHISALAAVLLAAYSCAEEPMPAETDAATGEETLLTFNFGHSEPMEVQTRSSIDHKYESQVHNFYLFVFDKDGNKVIGKYFDNEALCSSLETLEATYDNCWYVDNATSNDSSSTDYTTTGTVRVKVSSGTGMKIYMLANADADMARVSSDLLSTTIANEQDLLDFNVYMNQTTVMRNGYFPMSGVIKGVTIEKGESDTSVSTITGNTLQLNRIDAKVRFVFKTGSRPDEKGQTISKFKPISWQVLNVPRTTYAMGYSERGISETSGKDIVSVDPSTPYSDYSEYAADFFDSDPLTFEEYTSSTESAFTFYMFENRQTPKKSAGTDYQNRSMRAKISGGVNDQMNETCTVNYVVNGKSYERTMRCFEYANDFSTYVLVRGRVEMSLKNDSAGSTLGADVNYIIHLGSWNSTIDADGPGDGNDKYENLDDYNTIRNTSYTYTVTVNSVNNIRVEVESSNPESGEANVIENQPGAFGDVTVAKEEITVCDAHYVSRTINFKLKNFFEGGNISEEHKISDQLTWNIKTPFAEGEPRFEGDIDITDGLDYKWVHFRLNKKNEDGTYSTSRRKYVDRVFATSTTERSASDNKEGDGTTDGLGGYHNDGIMDVEYMVNYIKDQVDRYLVDPSSSAFDSTSDDDGGPKITVTVFVDEYYYDKDPLTDESDPMLWKKFVNADDRKLHILCDSKKSKDMESSATGSVVTIQQHAIQCIYNTDESNTGLTTAWGVEDTDEYDGMWGYWSTTNTSNRGNSDDSNGLLNTAKEWELCNASATAFNTGSSWWTYMNVEVPNETIPLLSDYRYVRYSCMTRNRDNNGDGKIDRDELRWYMASPQQLIGMFVGKNTLNKTTQLYNKSPEKKASSTTTDWQQHVISSKYGTDSNSNNPLMIWAEEGISTGNHTSWNDLQNASSTRCVRNLGYMDGTSDETYGLDVTPQNYITTTTDDDGVIYDAANMNTTATRYYTSKELPMHSEIDPENQLYKKFEMLSATQSMTNTAPWSTYWQTVGSKPGLLFKDFNTVVDDYIATGKTLCPDGYRIPNQVEMAVAYYFGNQTDDTFCRTYFSFGPADPYGGSGKESNKYGFKVRGNINVGNNETINTYRCVRDIRVDD